MPAVATSRLVGDAMAAPLRAAQYDAWANYRLPATEEFPDGVWAIALPTGEAGRSFVYVYVLRTDDGLALIDTGLDCDGAIDRLAGEIAAIGHRLEQISTILCTHYHRDHYGNVGELKRLTGARVGLHAIEGAILTTLRDHHAEHRQEQHRLWAAMGLTGVPETDAARAGNPFADVRPPDPDFAFVDNTFAPVAGRRLRVIWTPGHSPGHICLYDPDQAALFAGDVVLPRITPGVSLQPVQRANPLADFHASLGLLRALDVRVVFPGHEYAFADLDDRIAQLEVHHKHRLAEILAAVHRSPGQTCVEIAGQIGWSRPWDEMAGRYFRMAVSETLAHLVLLNERAVITREGYAPVRWSAVRDR
ncbi:MAG TPA: MBL fold metallo-hydrolase [Devosiaceae bacterium]|jgi:glyoxylase-like metal-dependent hydrolase (beta-lactamase superfamily II)